jgi:[protein-PII] uridylyltransferase
MVHSAHIATYGERAVDTFYVTDLFGDKIESKTRISTIERRLIEAANNQAVEQLSAPEFV